jgi:iron complex outermembrane receptor protein
MTQRWISLAAAAAVTGLVPTVQAQDQDTAGAATLDEIVVTARKREESVQEIPFVVNALTAEQMERASIQGLGDIALRTPGLNYEGYASAGQAGAAVIRGLAPTQLTNRIPNVAVFYDGVYLQNQALQDIGVFDIERVEVLKGPQSALYGRNAFAGAINYISRKPSNDWRAEVGATVGSDDRRDVNAFLSGPLSIACSSSCPMARPKPTAPGTTTTRSQHRARARAAAAMSAAGIPRRSRPGSPSGRPTASK